MQGINQAFANIVSKLVELLPTSPFAGFIDRFAGLPWLGVLNWFFPVRACLQVMLAWLAAIALFYLYSVIMRWVKVIGD